MHELSIATSLIDVASEEAERRGINVVAIHLRLGPLSGVVKNALLNAYTAAREGSPLAAARLVIVEAPVVAWCETCQCEQEIKSIQRLCCPTCESPTPDIRGGRELEIVGLEVIDEEPEAHDRDSQASAQ